MTDITKVGVVGAGLMGHGIAQVSAEAGYDVVLLDADQGALDRGLAAVGALLDRAVDKGRTTAEDADAVRARIQGTTDAEDLAGCDMVIEAIIEQPRAPSSSCGGRSTRSCSPPPCSPRTPRRCRSSSRRRRRSVPTASSGCTSSTPSR